MKPMSLKVTFFSKIPWLRIYFFAALAGMVFLMGLLAGMFRLAPVLWFEQSVRALQDWQQYAAHYAELKPQKFLHKLRKEFGGQPEIFHDPTLAQEGVTLVSSLWDGQNGMNLYDMNGEILHRWRVSFSEIWADTPEWPPQKIGDWDVDIHGMHLYPDGSVVFNFEYNGLVKIDRCSRVLWKLAAETHHSVETDEAGNLWVPGRKKHSRRHPDYPILKAGVEEDLILQVSPEGKILRTIPVLESLLKSDLAGIIFIARAADLGNQLTDIGHLNSIDILSTAMAPAFPLFKAGDILISLRNLNLVAMMDPVTEKIKWWSIGSFIQQHDPDFLPNGQIGLFDNRGEAENPNGSAYRASRILAIDPVTREIKTLLASDERNILFTAIRGNQQFLPNGNILVTEWVAGRIFEVTPEGNIAWQFIHRYNDEEVVQVSQAIRYDLSYGDFARSVETCVP